MSEVNFRFHSPDLSNWWFMNFHDKLVGGLEHFLFVHILGMSSSQLTFIFFRGVETTNQIKWCNWYVAVTPVTYRCDALLHSVSSWLAERFDRCMQDVAFAEVQARFPSCFLVFFFFFFTCCPKSCSHSDWLQMVDSGVAKWWCVLFVRHGWFQIFDMLMSRTMIMQILYI